MKFIILIVLCAIYVDQITSKSVDSSSSASSNDLNIKKEEVEKKVKITHISRDSNQYLVWDNITFIDYELAESFLKKFGNLAESISIDYPKIPLEHHMEIGKHVNVYCSETLKEFHTERCKDNAFDAMEKPFKNVKIVTLNGDWKRRTKPNNSLEFDELFPEMEQLNLSHDGFIVKYEGTHIVGRHYPHLIELNSDIHPFNNFFPFVINNPQIERLRLHQTSNEILKFLNDNLPNLQVLAFEVPYFEGPISIDNAKEVSVKDTRKHLRQGMFNFTQMKQLELIVDDNIEDAWIELIANSSSLTTLSISSGYFTDSSLLKLSTNSTNLIEAKINCDSTVEVESIAKFLEINKRLIALKLNFQRGSQLFYKRLTNRLSDGWRFILFNEDYTSFYITKPGVVISETVPITFVENLEKNVTETTSEIPTNNTANNSTEKPSGNASNVPFTSILTIAMLALFSSTVFALLD